MTDSEQRQYALTVFTEFLLLAGYPPTRCMSPLEWLCLKGWMDTGIPMRVVLRGFRDATRENGKRPGSLTYFDPAVREAYARNRAALGGWL